MVFPQPLAPTNEGHTEIACIAGHPNHYSTITRIEGYKQALEESGLAFNEDNVYYCNSENEISYSASKEIFKKCPRVTAVLITVNNMLLGFLRAAEENSLTVCKDISYATFSYDEFYSILPQKPTYVLHNTSKMSQV